MNSFDFHPKYFYISKRQITVECLRVAETIVTQC